MLFQRLDHIAFRVADLETVVDFYVETLGYEIVQKMNLDFHGSRAISNVLQLPDNPFFIFVDQGFDEDNIISRWVQKYGSGLHHMAYLVEDIEWTAGELRKRGMQFTTEQVIDTGGGLKQIFSLPNPGTGLITELIQREREGLFFVRENVLELIRSTEGL